MWHNEQFLKKDVLTVERMQGMAVMDARNGTLQVENQNLAYADSCALLHRTSMLGRKNWQVGAMNP